MTFGPEAISTRSPRRRPRHPIATATASAGRPLPGMLHSRGRLRGVVEVCPGGDRLIRSAWPPECRPASHAARHRKAPSFAENAKRASPPFRPPDCHRVRLEHMEGCEPPLPGRRSQEGLPGHWRGSDRGYHVLLAPDLPVRFMAKSNTRSTDGHVRVRATMANGEEARRGLPDAGAWPRAERRSCRIVGLSRSVQQYRPTPKNDEAVVERLKELASENRRYGYLRLHAVLRRRGWS